jgi:predicted transcriptional regulator
METGFTTVEDVMRTSLFKISGLASIKDAIDEMHRHDVSALVIERRHEGDEYGFITVSEIAARVIALNAPLDRTSVYEIMNKPTLTLNPKMNVKYAIRLLSQLQLRRALVTGDQGLLGAVTLRDMVLSYSNVKPVD